jgi:hypothetical protein
LTLTGFDEYISESTAWASIWLTDIPSSIPATTVFQSSMPVTCKCPATEQRGIRYLACLVCAAAAAPPAMPTIDVDDHHHPHVIPTPFMNGAKNKNECRLDIALRTHSSLSSSVRWVASFPPFFQTLSPKPMASCHRLQYIFGKPFILRYGIASFFQGDLGMVASSSSSRPSPELLSYLIFDLSFH